MPNFSILLPPAEGKQEGGNPYAPDMFDYRSSTTFNFFKDLNPERRQLIKAVRKAVNDLDADELEGVFGVKGDHLEAAIKANSDILNAPLMSALDRYSPGVMYQAMDFPGLPTGAQRRLLEEGIIFSGMFGLLRPDDLIPNYKLRMDSKVPGLGSGKDAVKVSQYWKPHVSEQLNRVVTGRFVWNLLSGIHEDAWDDAHTYDAMVRVKFMRKKSGKLETVSHGVKPLRGRLINYIVRETVEDLEEFHEWRHPDGYVMDRKLSSYDEDTRTHEIVMVKKG